MFHAAALYVVWIIAFTMAVGFCCKKVARKEGSIAIGNVMSIQECTRTICLCHSIQPVGPDVLLVLTAKYRRLRKNMKNTEEELEVAEQDNRRLVQMGKGVIHTCT